MLRLIIGKAGTGKTAAIYRELRRSVELGEHRRMLLVPEQYSHYGEQCGDSFKNWK